MKNLTKLTVALFAMATLSFVGCGGTDYSIAPVSGKVTCDGQPVPGIRLVFTPMPNEANTDPGPWSTGVTNAQGEYTLETRYKKNGAAVGKHTVSFEFEGDDGDAGSLEDLEEDLEDAREDGTREEFDAIKKQIDQIRAKKSGRPKINEEFTIIAEVPEGGTDAADFDLPK